MTEEEKRIVTLALAVVAAVGGVATFLLAVRDLWLK